MFDSRSCVVVCALLVGCGDKDPGTDPTEDTAPPTATEEDCTSGDDEDLDGLTDCADPDCADVEACLEDCASGVDEDLDGLVDCVDPDCAANPDCLEDCSNGVDEDLDGLIDCVDPDCAADPACQEDCSSGIDEDLDGLVDCDDTDCAADPACQEDCANGVDDDGDALVDCEDADCAAVAPCVEDCSSGIDDDGDGWTDCEDDDCWGVGGCTVADTWDLTGGRARLVIDATRSTLNTAGWSCRGGLSYFAEPVTDWRSDVQVQVTSLTGNRRIVAYDAGVPVRTESCGWTLGSMSARASQFQSQRTCSGGAFGGWGNTMTGSVRLSSACAVPSSRTVASRVGVGAGFVAAGAVPDIEDYWGFATLLTLSPTASTSTRTTSTVRYGTYYQGYGWSRPTWHVGVRQTRRATIDGTVGPLPSWYPLAGP